MRLSFMKVFAVLFCVTCYAGVASATPVQIGFLSFDTDGAQTTFNVTNLTGTSAFPPDFPIETLLTFTIANLTATTTGGPLAIGGGAFSSDAAGNLNCIAAGDASTGGCNFGAYSITSATVTGTLSPTTGLVGLPPGFAGIGKGFSATITPSCGQFLTAGCDTAIISATLRAVPEPSPALLMELGVGLLAGYRLYRPSLRFKRGARRT